VVNTLAYYGRELITAVNIFAEPVPGKFFPSFRDDIGHEVTAIFAQSKRFGSLTR
jgi:hypothetical protein